MTSKSRRGWMAVSAVAVLLAATGTWAQAQPAPPPAQGPVRGGGSDQAAPPSDNQLPATPVQEANARLAEANVPAVDANVPAVDPNAGTGPGPKDEGGWLKGLGLYGLLALMLVFLLWSSRRSRKEEKRRQAMLGDLKKGDKITTIGGIIGTVVEVRDNDVMVKVDESANTRIRFARSAVRMVGTPDEAEKKDERK